MAMSGIAPNSVEETRKSLADFLPNGSAFGNKNLPGKNTYQLLLGMCQEIGRVETDFQLILDEFDPRTTTLLLPEWEKAAGIPDDCFSNDPPPTGDPMDEDYLSSIDIRRLQVMAKIFVELDTRESFIALANMFGYECEIHNGTELGLYPLPYPWTYFGSPKQARFTMIVDFESLKAPDIYPFEVTKYPWIYSSAVTNSIECFFNKVKMASVVIIFRYVL